MSDNELLDRIEQIINDMDAKQYRLSGEPAGSADIAQAIIDDLGLTSNTPKCDWENKTHSLNCDCYAEPDVKWSRVVGKWEET